MTVLHLADEREAADLAAFLSRLLHYDRSAAVRLQAAGTALAVFGRPQPRWVLQILIEISGVAVFAVLFIASAVTVSRNMNSVTPVLEMPFWMFFAPLVIGSLLLVVETLAMLAHTWRAGRPEPKQTVLS